MAKIFSFVWFSIFIPIVFSSQQAVTVKGIVNCRGHRQPGTFVQLYDEDSIFDSDDLLGSVVADHRGVFCVKGSTEEFTAIEPYVFIEHNCGYEGLNEKRVFSKMIPAEYITEGAKAKHVYHLGDIELLTADAPVQKYEKRIYIETNMEERIRQCIPIYVQYKAFYEKTVFETKVHETVLPTDEEPVEVEEPVVEPTEGDEQMASSSEHITKDNEEHHVDHQEHHEVSDEERRIEEERFRLEEEQKRLDEIRRLEEESLRLEEIRRIEEEKKRIEEIRRQEEEQQRIELERREEERRLESERRAEEERKREEEAKLQEQRRREQEDEHKRRMEEYHRREQERQEALKRREEEIKRREEGEKTRTVSSSEKVEKKDPCVHYPVLTQGQSFSRSIELRHEYVEDPCLKK
ncbi:Transthyretin-like family protein [Caenorhabditis elegans]|uniref:Transthyretin-like family protein n=1 Tax=Caenorhabditis elegans TaxID=6239 RepID=Q22192_CAEEL|nr:Transthyretin-like family protein [Caenorhabditis elegans]CAA92135.1 Transthyretin-like family protein [Caenorhabditis elegans]|eukprot:NP_509801.1 TransThyretin-Related family domain [Caenorhabditis elegans]